MLSQIGIYGSNTVFNSQISFVGKNCIFSVERVISEGFFLNNFSIIT